MFVRKIQTLKQPAILPQIHTDPTSVILGLDLHHKKYLNERYLAEQKPAPRFSQLVSSSLTRDVWEANLSSSPKRIFFCKVVIGAIKAIFEKKYSCFDAHTTSNCCHGIALLVRNSILSAMELDLETILRLSKEKIEALGEDSSLMNSFTDWVPESLLILSGLYLLATVRDIDENGKMRTEAKKLRTIFHIGVEFCWTITNTMKKHFSNMVASSYEFYLQGMHLPANINGVPISFWGSYVTKEHIRNDKKGISYVSCIFSAQLALAYLISSQAKVAIVNDIISSTGLLRSRYIHILEGDGCEHLRSLYNSESYLEALDPSEPIVVFGGYVYSDSLTTDDLKAQMSPWINSFPRLLLACDTFYPQFPQVRDDPEFDSTPIIPYQDQLKKVILQHASIRGVSACDPSLYCSSHIYTASVGQVLDALKSNKDALPTCFHGLQPSTTEPWGKRMFHFL